MKRGAGFEAGPASHVLAARRTRSSRTRRDVVALLR